MKRISATDAKNNFGGLLEDVASLGCIEIVRHGRVVAIVLSPRALGSIELQTAAQAGGTWGVTHMIPPELALRARMLSQPQDFDDD